MVKKLWRNKDGHFEFVNISCATCPAYIKGECEAIWFNFELSETPKDCIIPFHIIFDTVEEFDNWCFQLLDGTEHTKMTYKCVTKIGEPCYVERAFIQSEFFKIEIPLIDVIIREINQLWSQSNYGTPTK